MTGHAPSRSCSPQSPQRLVLLGSTGSIGTQTLEVLARLGQAAPRVAALAAGGSRLELLARQA
ncbi:1-deoxy-D-xylulose 5-phosphate reductoisomerase, partial [Actinomyces johnsonii F0542]